MHTISIIKGGILTPKGFKGATASAGIKTPGATRLDLAVIYSEFPSTAAATFTSNQVKAAPVKLSAKHMENGDVRAIFANSGNANACTGEVGDADAMATVESIASELSIKPNQVALCSTGVIGLPMPMERLLSPLPEMIKGIDYESGTDIAKAIMTSDTCHKEIAIKCDVDGVEFTVGACAKGAGMICPNMATMLCFITTDLKVEALALKKATKHAVDHSFNCITIDGDTSTNDSVIVLANGAIDNDEVGLDSPIYEAFQDAMNLVALEMAKALVRDGERVTKFVTVEVINAKTPSDACAVANSVANSSLVKASWNGEDPNWGRVIHAVGYSGAEIIEEKINISYNGLAACVLGLQATTEMAELRKIAQEEAFTVTIDLQLGTETHKIYSSDLSPEYVDFNRSEYAYWKQAKKDGLV